ncbi:MAG TPA: hypothetical protein VIK59_10700 [Verrucomicrobiae bacterium]
MKLNYKRKMVLLGFLILVIGAGAKSVWDGARNPASITWETLRYLTMPTPILLILILVAIFALAGREKQ